MPVSFQQVSIRPERLKGWAMFTTGSPFSRAASAEGIQLSITSAPPAREHLRRRDVGTPLAGS